MSACEASLAWFQQFYPHAFHPPNPASFFDWVPYIAMDISWKGRLKAAARSCIRHQRAIAEHHVWQKRFEDSFLLGGGVVPSAQSVRAESWTCEDCGKIFSSKRALASHAGRAHGYRRIVKFFAVDATCNSCGKFYHSRKRFIEHLKDVPACLETLQACFPALTDERVHELDQIDHEHTLKMRGEGWWSTKALLPVQKILGPLLPPKGSQDAAAMWDKWSTRLQASGTAFQNLRGRMSVEAVEQPQVRLFEADMPAFVFQSAKGPNAGNGKFAAEGLARLHARLHIRSLVFVHVFSGFRRDGDLHSLLSQQVWGNVHFFIISIDMCMQKVQGNLATSESFRFWMKQIANGQVIGMGGGPPLRDFHCGAAS